MRITIDLPDELLQQVRLRLQGQDRSFCVVVFESPQCSLQQQSAMGSFRLVDGVFTGPVGFCPGFSADHITGAIYEEAEYRLNPP